MSDEAVVILEFSHDVQTLLQKQRVDIYQELQRALPSIRLSRQADPDALAGTRDLVTVISVTTSLVVALTPIIRQILNMITSPNQSESLIIDETETTNPDGSRIIYRKRVWTSSEQRVTEPQPPNKQSKAIKAPSSPDTKETKEQ